MDITAFLDTTSRAIANRERNGEPVKVLEVSRCYATDSHHLWSLLTDIEKIPNWFLPVTGDLRIGGRYQFERNAGGEILECEPHKRIYITWEFGGQVSWVELTLSETAGGVNLKLLHTAAVPDEMWDQFGPGAVGIGWESGLLGLENHLGSGLVTTPEKGMTWMASPEGKSFIDGCSDKWAAASIAAGTPAENAKAAAQRTAAAYKGEA